MKAPKNRPARRGYVAIAALILIIYGIGMGKLHWDFVKVTVWFLGLAGAGLLVTFPVYLKVNREARRR